MSPAAPGTPAVQMAIGVTPNGRTFPGAIRQTAVKRHSARPVRGSSPVGGKGHPGIMFAGAPRWSGSLPQIAVGKPACSVQQDEAVLKSAGKADAELPVQVTGTNQPAIDGPVAGWRDETAAISSICHPERPPPRTHPPFRQPGQHWERLPTARGAERRARLLAAAGSAL